MQPQPSAPVESGQRRSPLLLAAAAGLCWAGAVSLMLMPNIVAEPPLAPLRMIFYCVVLVAALLTFVPIQQQLRIPGLALQGTLGALVLLYALAFIPPPSGPIFQLPELPVYVIFLGALFAVVSAAALPVVFWIGGQVFQNRARRYDLRRARRQAYEVASFAVACGALAALRILSPLSFVLVALIVVVAETLFLAYIETPS